MRGATRPTGRPAGRWAQSAGVRAAINGPGDDEAAHPRDDLSQTGLGLGLVRSVLGARGARAAGVAPEPAVRRPSPQSGEREEQLLELLHIQGAGFAVCLGRCQALPHA